MNVSTTASSSICRFASHLPRTPRSGAVSTLGCGRQPALGYSRQIFLQFCFGNAMANFLRGHVAAFASFTGVPRVLLYDNLKSAVLERVGQAIHFNPTLLDLAAHYRFAPRPVAVARGNEKDQAPYCNPFRGCTASDVGSDLEIVCPGALGGAGP